MTKALKPLCHARLVSQLFKEVVNYGLKVLTHSVRNVYGETFLSCVVFTKNPRSVCCFFFLFFFLLKVFFPSYEGFFFFFFCITLRLHFVQCEVKLLLCGTLLLVFTRGANNCE